MAKLPFIFGGNLHFCCAGIIFTFCVSLNGAECTGGATAMKALHKKLLDGYNPMIRPSHNYSTPTDVIITLHISVVMGLDTKHQLMRLRAFIRIMWTDEYLQWDTNDHEGITRIVILQNLIWKPDLILFNAANELDNLGNERIFISVNSNGFAKWEPPFYLESTCKLDMSKYPFDVSICPVVISSWMTDNQSMIMRWTDNPVNLDNMMINGEYDITSAGVLKKTFAYDDQFFETVAFQLRLARRPGYIVVSLLVPVNLLAILGILSFMMPPNEPEKVAISITILLSFTVFLSVIDSNIPPTSDNVSLLVIYVSSLLVMSFLSVVGNVFIVTIKRWDENEVAENLNSSIENIIRLHPTTAMSFKTSSQVNIKSSHGTLEANNYDPLLSDKASSNLFLSQERKTKTEIPNTRANKLNKTFMIASFAAFVFISLPMLLLINV